MYGLNVVTLQPMIAHLKAGKEIIYAVNSISDCFGCCWGNSLGDKQLHTDAGYHKENLECCSDYCSYFVAFECLRTHRKPLNDSYWEVKSMKIGTSGRSLPMKGLAECFSSRTKGTLAANLGIKKR
jgi:hypothetical protein